MHLLVAVFIRVISLSPSSPSSPASCYLSTALRSYLERHQLISLRTGVTISEGSGSMMIKVTLVLSHPLFETCFYLDGKILYRSWYYGRKKKKKHNAQTINKSSLCVVGFFFFVFINRNRIIRNPGKMSIRKNYLLIVSLSEARNILLRYGSIA